jgi:hypothetical protein
MLAGFGVVAAGAILVLLAAIALGVTLATA